jgi:hypothetical protein
MAKIAALCSQWRGACTRLCLRRNPLAGSACVFFCVSRGEARIHGANEALELHPVRARARVPESEGGTGGTAVCDVCTHKGQGRDPLLDFVISIQNTQDAC